MFSEMLSEGTLITESVVECDFADLFLGGTEVFAGCLNPGFDEKGAWVGAEHLPEAAIELPD